MLTPCMQCRRHIAEERCPFCGGVATAPRELPRQSGRLSRAAMFVGALALPGCKGNEPAAPAHTTTETATTAGSAVPQPAAPADATAPDASLPVSGDAPSAPPLDAGTTKSSGSAAAVDPATRGSLVVIPRLGTSKKPLQRFMVDLMPSGRDHGRGAVTGSDGRAHFDNLVPGEYLVRWRADSPTRRGPPPELSTKKVTVVADQQIEVEIAVHTYLDHPLVTPYGAPSARNRRV